MCKFCEEGKVPNLKRGEVNLEIYINKNNLIVEAWDEDKYATFVEINYCPVCGRKLRGNLLSEEELLGL